MSAYYNEHDPFAAAWLRELIKARYIAPGVVDERSIEDVRPDELAEYTQCHFFAGIGGWSYALRLAGWPDDKPVWTGSCPCQPFSAAGKGEGFVDERHLWPAFFHLIEQCQPGVVFGEQVEAAIRHGWLDLVQTDLEGIGYAVGAVGLPAAGVGAPHIRQRLWFVADRAGELGESDSTGPQPREQAAETLGHGGAAVSTSGLGDTQQPRLQEQRRLPEIPCSESDTVQGQTPERTGAPTFWDACDWLPCLDGKARPVEPASERLPDGLSGSLGLVRLSSYPDRPNEERLVYAPLIQKGKARVGRLRGYGNAIVPQVAAEVIRAYLHE